jgi:tRNA (mo5U34)-methyltransferase
MVRDALRRSRRSLQRGDLRSETGAARRRLGRLPRPESPRRAFDGSVEAMRSPGRATRATPTRPAVEAPRLTLEDERGRPLDRADLLALVDQLRWYHTIDVGEGRLTPGLWGLDTQEGSRAVMDLVDFRGKRVLDIGCLDGLWSFEAERRGAAEVYSVDLVSQVRPRRDPCYLLARELRGSRARYFPHTSVFDVGDLGVSDFDVVLFFGVYYHLKDPLLAFARLRQVMKEGGVLLVEGQAIQEAGAWALFLYRRHYLDEPSNWWIPTVQCLREWIECSFFDIEGEHPQTFAPEVDGVTNTGRMMFRARAVRRADPRLIYRDPELAEFDLNAYDGPDVGRAVD